MIPNVGTKVVWRTTRDVAIILLFDTLLKVMLSLYKTLVGPHVNIVLVLEIHIIKRTRR